MSRGKKVIKKKVIGTKKESTNPASFKSSRRSKKDADSFPLLFTRDNYMFMLIGVGLIGLGLILMMGGSMPTPDQWDENVIYSFRRTVLAPFVILVGLGIEIYAIFKS